MSSPLSNHWWNNFRWNIFKPCPIGTIFDAGKNICLPPISHLTYETTPQNLEKARSRGETVITLHLKIKKLSTNSPRDFNSVLDTINHY